MRYVVDDVDDNNGEELDINVLLAMDCDTEFFLSPYDAGRDDSEVDIDLLYRWDLTKTCKLRLKTHQEPIPCVPVSDLGADAHVLWTYLGESEMDQLGHLLLRENVGAFVRSFPQDDELLCERFCDFKGIRVARAYAAVTGKPTPGVQFRKHIMPNKKRCIIAYAETVPGYTIKDGVLVVYFRWLGPALKFLIKRRDELE